MINTDPSVAIQGVKAYVIMSGLPRVCIVYSRVDLDKNIPDQTEMEEKAFRTVNERPLACASKQNTMGTDIDQATSQSQLARYTAGRITTNQRDP